MNLSTCMRISLAALLPLLGACGAGKAIVPDPGFAAAEPPPLPSAAEVRHGSIYSAASGAGLFEDRTALRVGDILTIVLSESTAASTSASTSTSKADSLDLGIPTLFGGGVRVEGRDILQNSNESDRSFSGTGDSSQSNSLDGEITVTVAQVFANGNMAIRGEKIIGINQGAEFVRLSGVVRPQDVRPDNTVLSSRVANAQIYYGGGGALAETNRKGWLARFFNSEFWPF